MLDNIDKTRIDEVVEFLNKVFLKLKQAVENLMKSFKQIIKTFVKNPPLGYRTQLKRITYINHSIGKSNNWRKIHGLTLKRSRFYGR